MRALTPQEETFLHDNILCVLCTTKSDGAPQATNFYFYEDGQPYISVTKKQAKARNVQRDPRVSVVVQHPEWPFPHMQIQGRATITEDDLETHSARIFSIFRPSLPENFLDELKEQQRQVMVVTPERVISHLGRATKQE